MSKNLHVRFLAIFVLMGIVPFAVFGLILIRQQSETLEAQASRELMSLASSLSVELDNQLTDRLQDACAFATVPDIVSMEPGRQVPVLETLLSHSVGYGQLAVADLSGQLQAVGRDVPLVSISHVPSFQSAKNGEQDWAVFPALFNDDLILHMHTPIIDLDDVVVGVLGSPVGFPTLAQSLELISIGDGRAFVLDADGRVLIHSHPEQSTLERDYSSLIEATLRLPMSESNSITYRVDDTSWIAGFSVVPTFNWIIVTERPEADVLRPAVRSRNLALGGLIGGILLCFLLAYLMARGLTGPVRKLAHAANALGNGMGDVPLHEEKHQTVEITALIRSFEFMRNSVLEREQSLRQFHHAMSASIDGMAILENGRFIYVNRALAELYSVKNPIDLLGQGWLSQFSKSERAKHEAEMTARTRTEGTWRGELALEGPRGTVTYLDVSLTKIGLSESILVLRDLAERKEAEDTLILAQKLESLGLMAGGIAHDFNNLLAAILGQSYVAKKKVPSDSPARDHIERIIQSGRRATDLTQQLLAYAGKGNSIATVFDINEMIQANAYILDTAISLDIGLNLELSNSTLLLEADRGQIQQIVMNLVINAAEAIGDDPGTICLRTGLCIEMGELACPEGATAVHHDFAREDVLRGICVVLEVQDSGQGMSRKTVQRIFDPFFTTKENGSGLGLSAMLGIVQSLGGSVSVCSTDGRGSLFRILLPTAKAESVDPPVYLANDSTFSGTALVADDELAVRTAMQDVLESCGLNVLVASDGHEAVELYRANYHRINLTLLDMRMPNMDGLNALKSIKLFDEGARVVLMSGYTESNDVSTMIDNRTVFFMEKPYSYEQLISHVEKAAVGVPS